MKQLFSGQYILFLLCTVSAAHGKNWNISPEDNINWKKVKNNDVICLSGERTGSLVIRKNITLDGNCYSKEPAILKGSIVPDWKKAGDYWVTKESFPLDYGRYTSWVFVNGELKLTHDANIIRKEDYFYSSTLPVNIEIPKYYAAIRVKKTSGVTIKNLIVKNYVVHGIVISNSKNTVIDNVSVSYVGGGVSSKRHQKAGAGITFDGDTYNVLVKNSSVSQCFDTGISIQLFKKHSEHAEKIRFLNNKVDRCGAGVSVAVHKSTYSTIDDVEIVGEFTNLGYGWSGIYDNNVHGRGVMVKQFNNSRITNIKLHDSLIDTYAWIGVLQYSGEFDIWNNVIKNGTGEYNLSRNLRPAAYTASGLDYSSGPSDDEAIGSFYNNKIVGINGYAFQVVHNTPKVSTRQLTIRDNIVTGQKENLRMYHSSGLIQ